MRTIKQIVLLFLASFALFTLGCKKDKKSEHTVPEVTTNDLTNQTATTAIGGGTIVSNGGENISASGVCWSTNTNPTILDDTTKGTTSSGSFTATLKNLTSSTTYYVRAYAINRIGIGYGEVKHFVTGNAAPVVTNVTVTGTVEVGLTLTATYTYSDNENDAESGTTFKWYVADAADGTNETVINAATASTFTVQPAQFGKFIRVGVTPKAAAGTIDGIEVKSSFRDGEPTTLTFSYDGQQVTYGIILSATTGKKWLDRNLGATRVAQDVHDYLAIGDMFQWGRLADGHQKVTRTDGTDAGATGVTGISTTRSDVDVPVTNQFITTTSISGDWRKPQNKNLWQGVNGVNNPCPTGWRIATEQEWNAEGLTSIDDAFSKLKITYTGYRDFIDGTFGAINLFARLWTSTVHDDDQAHTIQVFLDATSVSFPTNVRGYGIPCRCIKD